MKNFIKLVWVFSFAVFFYSCKTVKKTQKVETTSVETVDSIRVSMFEAQYDVAREDSREVVVVYPLDTVGGYYEAVININRDTQITIKSNKPIKSIKVKEYKKVDSSGVVGVIDMASGHSLNATTKLEIKEKSKWGGDFWFWFFIIIAIIAGGYVTYRIHKNKP